MTNYDIIHAMSLDRLAKWMQEITCYDLACCSVCEFKERMNFCDIAGCRVGFKMWLEREAEHDKV